MSRIKICAAEEQIRKNVSSAQDEFIRHCRIRNLSLRTIDYYQEDIEYFLKWSNLKFVDDITKDVMDNFVAHEMDKGNKVTAINSRIRGLRVFFRFCVDKEYMDGFKYPLLKVDQEQKEPYTNEELKRLLKRPRGAQWTEWRNWAIVNTFLATGIRASTLVNIRVSDLDIRQDTIFLQKLKNRKQQTLPISKSLKAVLQAYMKLWAHTKDDFLFPTHANTKMSVHGLEAAISRYNINRGVSKTSIHLFRHTFAKNYILAGGGMLQLQAILGHSTLDMTRKYVNLYGKDVHRDFDRLNPLNNILNSN